MYYPYAVTENTNHTLANQLLGIWLPNKTKVSTDHVWSLQTDTTSAMRCWEQSVWCPTARCSCHDAEPPPAPPVDAQQMHIHQNQVWHAIRLLTQQWRTADNHALSRLVVRLMQQCGTSQQTCFSMAHQSFCIDCWCSSAIVNISKPLMARVMYIRGILLLWMVRTKYSWCDDTHTSLTGLQLQKPWIPKTMSVLSWI